MHLLPQIIFIITLALFGYLIGKRVKRIKGNIQIGRSADFGDRKPERWKTMMMVAMGQKKMFKKLIPAFLHLLIYVGFILINIEVLEIIIDGVIGTHRVFAFFLGSFYTFLISFFEILAALVVLACIVFLVRRNILKVDRFKKIEMLGWPTLDGNLILIIEIVLMAAILTMNAADISLQAKGAAGYTNTGTFLISNMISPWFEQVSLNGLIIIERAAWWIHIVGIFGFALYVTHSKHLHIFLAFPTTFYSRLESKGKIGNMPEITNEVKMMLGVPVENDVAPPADGLKFGAKDVNDLTWKNLMESYSCTECGRCTSECPANLTGKKLSPRKIMMDTRDRVEEVGSSVKGLEDGKSLLGDYITKEEINACTSCNACVEACPININPLEIILQLRRYSAMEESAAPASWNSMFSNVETNFAPWKFAPSDRFNWADELKSKS